METDLAIFQTIQDFGSWKKAGRAAPVQARGLRHDRSGLQGRGRRLHRGQRQHHRLRLQHQAVPAAEVPKSALDFLTAPVRRQAHHHRSDRGRRRPCGVQHDRGEIRLGLHGQVHGAEAELRDHGHAAVSNAIAAGEKLATFDSTSTTPRLKAQGKPIEPVFSQATTHARCSWSAPRSSRTRRTPTRPSCILTWYLAKEQQSRTGTFSPRADVPPPPAWRRSRPTSSTPDPGAVVGRGAPDRTAQTARQLYRAAVRTGFTQRMIPRVRARESGDQSLQHDARAPQDDGSPLSRPPAQNSPDVETPAHFAR